MSSGDLRQRLLLPRRRRVPVRVAFDHEYVRVVEEAVIAALATERISASEN